MRKKYRIVLVDDHNLIRAGLRALLSDEPDFEVVGEANDGREAIHIVEQLTPDIVLMDLCMPGMNGFEAIKEIKRQRLETKILALTVHKTEEYILTTLEAGADGYVLKEADQDELMMAIRKVLSGKRYLSPDISEMVIEGYLLGRKELKSKPAWNKLTQREREILKLIAEGNKTKEIATYLCISSKTVEKHRASLMRKLNLRNIAKLTAFAVEKGITA